MEQNLPIITKKVWNMVRLAFFMLRKGISKKKILLDINLIIKRGKIASKLAFSNLIFQHYHRHNHHVSASKGGVGASSDDLEFGGPTNAPKEYEFSCKNTPLYRHYFTNKKKNYQYHQNYYYYMSSSPKVDENNKDGIEAINKILETMLSSKDSENRQIRITDSPYPLQNEDDNHHVDEAAEEFIKRFYSQLKKQDYC
ncbi:Receptor tyrosine-protein kinase erbB-4 [Bienertia sinuspersici]